MYPLCAWTVALHTKESRMSKRTGDWSARHLHLLVGGRNGLLGPTRESVWSSTYVVQLTFEHLDGRIHSQTIFLDHGPDDLPKVPFSYHVLKLDVFPLQDWIAERLRLWFGSARERQCARVELQNGLFPL